jgi:hypothetical protein
MRNIGSLFLPAIVLLIASEEDQPPKRVRVLLTRTDVLPPRLSAMNHLFEHGTLDGFCSYSIKNEKFTQVNLPVKFISLSAGHTEHSLGSLYGLGVQINSDNSDKEK